MYPTKLAIILDAGSSITLETARPLLRDGSFAVAFLGRQFPNLANLTYRIRQEVPGAVFETFIADTFSTRSLKSAFEQVESNPLFANLPLGLSIFRAADVDQTFPDFPLVESAVAFARHTIARFRREHAEFTYYTKGTLIFTGSSQGLESGSFLCRNHCACSIREFAQRLMTEIWREKVQVCIMALTEKRDGEEGVRARETMGRVLLALSEEGSSLYNPPSSPTSESTAWQDEDLPIDLLQVNAALEAWFQEERMSFSKECKKWGLQAAQPSDYRVLSKLCV